MTRSKRWIAWILSLTLIFGLLPMTAFPAEATGETAVETEPIEMESGETEPAETETMVTEPSQMQTLETEPAETESVQMEETTAPTETEPAGAVTEPTEAAVTEPTEDATEPTEETTAAAEMRTESAVVGMAALAGTETVDTEAAAETAVVIEPFENSIELYASTYGESENAEFLFTPAVTAVYEFRSASDESEAKTGIICDSDGEELARDASGGPFVIYCKLEAGQTYTLTADYTDESYSGEFTVYLTRICELQLDELTEMEITTGGEKVTYRFAPEETGTYDFCMNVGETFGEIVIYDMDRNQIAYDNSYRSLTVSCGMTAGQTYIIQTGFMYSSITGKLSAYITPVSELTLDAQADASIRLGEQKARYAFTPEETSVYVFRGFGANDYIEGEIWDSEGNWICSSSGNGHFTVYYQLEAGKTYTLTVSYDDYRNFGSFSVQLSKVPELLPDTPVTVTLDEPGEIAIYQFAPDTTERYAISAEAEYNLDLRLRTAKDEYLDYEYDYGGTSSQVFYTMEAGQTYVFEVGYQSTGWTGTITSEVSVVHAYAGEPAVTPPDCTTPGQRVFTCIHCNEEIT